jgi:alkylated DNA nucleotide flippase Atl1
MQADMIPWWRVVAASRTQAVRRILAGEDAAAVAARHPGRIRSALSAVDQMMA